MKTSKFLTALALPLAFVACSDDYLENNGPVANEFGNRPMVGQVEFNDVASSLTRYAVDGSANLSWATGDQFGMVLMDEQADAAGNANISGRYYNLVNKAYTNYPFTRNESGAWVSEAQLVEGNYFYYFPYVQAQKGDRSVSRAAGLTWNIPSTQEFMKEDNAYKSVQANQLYIGYQALNADAATTKLDNKMVPVFPTLTFNITNTDASSVVINRIVLEKSDGTGYGSAANAFNTKFTLNVEGGKSSAIDFTNIDLDGNAQNGAEKDLDVEGGWMIHKAFGSYNLAKKEERDDYTKSPFANMQTSYLTAVANAKASTFVLELPDVELAKDADYKATLVVPSDIDPEDLQVRIYTNKGIVLLPLTVDNYQVSVISGMEDEDEHLNGLVRYDAYPATGEGALKEGAVADASVALAVLKADKKWDVYGEAENDVRTNFTSLVPNQNATVSIKFNSNAIAVPGKMDIYSTEDLDAFLSYAKAANVTKDTYMEATLKANGITLSKEAYDILNGNDKIKLTVKADQNRTLAFAAEAGRDALYKLELDATITRVVLEGEKELTGNVVPVIENKGNLTVVQTYTTGNNPTKITIETGDIYNVGTLKVNGLLTADVINGANASGYGYDQVVSAASVVVAANLNGKLTNAAVAEVNDNVTIDDVENQKWTKSKNSDKVATLKSLNNVTFGTLSNAGTLTVDSKKTLVVAGTSSSTGTITNNGMFKPSGEFTNQGTMNNNYGIVCQTTGTFANAGTLKVAAAAVYTYISSNNGMIVIEERNENLTIAGAQGDISYTANNTVDFEDEAFLVYEDDKFNMLTVKRNGADLSAIYEGIGGTVVNKVILEVGADSELKFAEGQSLTALTIGTGNNLVDVKAKGMVVTTDLTIKNNTTLHIPNGYDVKFNGTSISNSGILLVGGTFSAINMDEPTAQKQRYEEAGGNIIWKGDYPI